MENGENKEILIILKIIQEHIYMELSSKLKQVLFFFPPTVNPEPATITMNQSFNTIFEKSSF